MKTSETTVPLFNPNEVRAHFIRQGTNYTAWADARGFGAYNVSKIMHGKQLGIKRNGRRIVKALQAELRRSA